MKASELMESLARDADYLARVAERDQRIEGFRQEFASEDAELAKEIVALGYEVASVWDLVNNAPHPFLPRPFIGPYERAYPLLVKHLATRHHSRVREGIIRSLTVRDGGELVSSALLEQFLLETDRGLKWVLANALKVAMPMRERRRHPEIESVYRRKNAP